jgi:hypothetical protein
MILSRPSHRKKNRDSSQLTQPPEKNRSFSAAFFVAEGKRELCC